MPRFVNVLYFAWLRERIGISGEQVALPEQIETVAALVDYLAGRGGGYAAAFANRRTISCAVNQEFADPSSAIKSGDEVGFFPPVTGG